MSHVRVTSNTKAGVTYDLTLDEHGVPVSCSCPNSLYRSTPCSHMKANTPARPPLTLKSKAERLAATAKATMELIDSTGLATQPGFGNPLAAIDMDDDYRNGWSI